MKKTILLILAVLPIVLLIVVAFAGRILSISQHIPVESVQFLNGEGDPYGEDDVFKLTKGETLATSIIVHPELAKTKTVTYTSSDESICTVDKNGNVTGVDWGTAYITVKTDDGGKTAFLNVSVTSDVPVGVTLSESELSLIEGEQKMLTAEIEPLGAKYNTVLFSSDNPSVATVDSLGKVTARAKGTATITATTKEGGRTATCTVTVVEGELPFKLDFSTAEGISFNNGFYVLGTNSIRLLDYLKVGEGVNANDIVFKIQSGSKATLEDNILAFHSDGSVTVRMYDKNHPDAVIDVKFFYAP